MRTFLQPQSRVFQVRVFYVEPSYARAREIPESEYKGTFYVHAFDEQLAEELAVAEFNETARQSGVSWARQIVRCEVRSFETIEA